MYIFTNITFFSFILKNIFILIYLFNIVVFYCVASCCVGYVETQFGFLSMISMAFYVVLLIISFLKDKFFWFLFPVVLLCVPNAVNDLFPSVAMSFAGIDGGFSFSIFTHIDIYLFFAFIKYVFFKSKNNICIFFLLSSIYLSILLAYLSGVWVVSGLFGAYQVRYASLIFLLFRFGNFYNFKHYFVFGLILCVTFLFFESFIYSYTAEYTNKLVSGNLGKNVLGHFGASILCFFLFFRLQIYSFLLKFYVLTLATVLLVGTGTRFSIVAAISSVLLTIFASYSWGPKKVFFSCIGLFLIFFFFRIAPPGISIVNGLYQVPYFVSSVAFVPDSDSSSILTRISIWIETLSMVKNNLFIGVGPGGWAFLKEEYGIFYEGLLDPHNDFLHLVISYGILLGVSSYALLFVFPFISAWRAAFMCNNRFYRGAVALLLCMFFAGFSNALLWKHQIFAIVCSFSCILFFNKYDKSV